MTKSAGKVVKKAKRIAGKANSDSSMSDQDRHRLIAEVAYYKAEQRNFMPGLEHIDWYEAEQEVDKRLRRE